MGGLENPPKHAYVIFEWSLRDKCKNSFFKNLTRRQKIKKSLVMISHNKLNLETFISSLAAPDINLKTVPPHCDSRYNSKLLQYLLRNKVEQSLIEDIKIGCIAAPGMRLN